jgi:hypothetical protein
MYRVRSIIWLRYARGSWIVSVISVIDGMRKEEEDDDGGDGMRGRWYEGRWL